MYVSIGKNALTRPLAGPVGSNTLHIFRNIVYGNMDTARQNVAQLRKHKNTQRISCMLICGCCCCTVSAYYEQLHALPRTGHTKQYFNSVLSLYLFLIKMDELMVTSMNSDTREIFDIIVYSCISVSQRRTADSVPRCFHPQQVKLNFSEFKSNNI